MKNIFAVYKPKGPTSFAIIAQARKIFGVKKIGHAGTLDPLASGVLVIGVGREATKRLGEVVAKEKEYLADIKLGWTSTTDDAEGEKAPASPKEKITKAMVAEILPRFLGTIEQTPPAYSAIKVAGPKGTTSRRAYQLARRGEAVILKPRPALIKEIEIIKYRYPDLRLRVVTGPGVYIRALARDIGRALGSGAYLTGLERTRVGDFTLKNAVKLEDLVALK